MTEQDALLKPTLHVEVLIEVQSPTPPESDGIRYAVAEYLKENYAAIRVGDYITNLEDSRYSNCVATIEIADYTGPGSTAEFHNVDSLQLDVQTYSLHTELSVQERRGIPQDEPDEPRQIRVLPLPNLALHDDWNSLVFEDALPAQLLRYLVRMVSLMAQPGLKLSAFNWNRLCLLHGPPGSGKSTLCRALAQKLSIRLGDKFAKPMLVEINANAMLSKYFGESGKLISATFDRICTLAQNPTVLVCVVIDEVETIAGSRSRSTSAGECQDGLRATNQLLTALDRLRKLPNVIVLCTSNLVEAIDPAFLDRVDIKQLVPSPSEAAIYKIFSSCINELVRSSLVDVPSSPSLPPTVHSDPASSTSNADSTSLRRRPATRSSKARSLTPAPSSSPESWTIISSPTIPSFSNMMAHLGSRPDSPGSRVWSVAQKCEGFSGRTLRRLPILGLAMYTWGGDCTVQNAVSALEVAVDQELMSLNRKSS